MIIFSFPSSKGAFASFLTLLITKSSNIPPVFAVPLAPYAKDLVKFWEKYALLRSSLANSIVLGTSVSSLQGLHSQFEAEALASSSVVSPLTQGTLSFVFCILCKGSRGASCQSVREGLRCTVGSLVQL